MNILTRLLSKTYTNHDRVDYESILPKFDYRSGITKQINQIFISPKGNESSIPEKLQSKIESLKDNNPGWGYKIYQNKDIEDFIKTHYNEEIWTYYDRIDDQYLAAKADLFRFLLIYKEGGVYFDLKIQSAIPLDKCLYPNDSFILIRWDNISSNKFENFGMGHLELKHIPRGEFVTGIIIASPGHPFLRSVILRVLENIDNYNPYTVGIGFYGSIRLAGPVPYSLAIYEDVCNEKYKGLYRDPEFGQDFGFSYIPSSVKNILKNDYRKSWKPLVKQRSWIKQLINIIYHKLISLYRRHRFGVN